MKTPVNVAITGAAGQIGYALAFRVAGLADFDGRAIVIFATRVPGTGSTFTDPPAATATCGSGAASACSHRPMTPRSTRSPRCSRNGGASWRPDRRRCRKS